MKYFDLVDEMSSTRRWHVGEIVLPDGTEPDLIRGGRLEHSGPLRAEVHHIGYVLEYCRTSFGVPIATRVLAHAISSVVGPDVQSIPITISGQSGMMVLNALRYIRCVNEQRSEFIKWTKHDHRPDLAGKYRSVPKIVLDRNTIPPDAHFFRIKDWEIALIVSETVKNAMVRVGCYGAEFTELELA